MHRLRPLLVALGLALGLAACTPQDVIRAVFEEHGEVVVQQAIRVAECESGFDLNAVSPSGGHYGWFQLSKRYHERRAAALGFTWDDVRTNAWANAEVAEDLYSEAGWAPWSCRP